MLRGLLAAAAAVGAMLARPTMGWAEGKRGKIAPQVSTGTSGPDGTRTSSDSEWTKFTVPDNFAINSNGPSDRPVKIQRHSLFFRDRLRGGLFGGRRGQRP